MGPADRRSWYRKPWLLPVGIVVASAALGALAAPDDPPARPAAVLSSPPPIAPATTVGRIAVAKPPAPAPPTTPAPPATPEPPATPPPTAAPGACDPSYPDLCLSPKAEDYDCREARGTGRGMLTVRSGYAPLTSSTWTATATAWAVSSLAGEGACRA
jgi:hypothetical protein